MKNFESYAVFIFAGILLIIVLGIALVLGQSSNNKPEPVLISPTPFKSNLPYEKESGDRLADVLVNRKPLSSNDQVAKDALLTNANPDSIYKTANMNISYVADLGLFESEILSTNIQKAKDETKRWFLSKGISEAGICNIPVTFTLSPDVESRLPDNTEPFNPLPPGC